MKPINQLKLINEKIAQYLAQKDELKRLERELDALKKTHIEPFCDSVIDQFVDEKYTLGGALITRKANPPKLQYTNGKELSKKQREQLCNYLPAIYATTAPMASKILENINFDKTLSNILKEQEINILQSSRYDITRL